MNTHKLLFLIKRPNLEGKHPLKYDLCVRHLQGGLVFAPLFPKINFNGGVNPEALGTERWHLGWHRGSQVGDTSAGRRRSIKSEEKRRKASLSALLSPPGQPQRVVLPGHPGASPALTVQQQQPLEGTDGQEGAGPGQHPGAGPGACPEPAEPAGEVFLRGENFGQAAAGRQGKDEARRSSHLLIPVKLFFPFTASSWGCVCLPFFPRFSVFFSFSPLPQ